MTRTMTRTSKASGYVGNMLLVGSLLAGSACASNPSYHHNGQVTDSQGDVVNQSRDDAGRYAHQAPPPDRPETPPARPGPQYLWVSGHQSWDGNDFQWHAGQWAVPPTGYHTWTVGRWEQSGSNNWVYVEGQWQ
jgi:hypothetical protein